MTLTIQPHLTSSLQSLLSEARDARSNQPIPSDLSEIPPLPQEWIQDHLSRLWQDSSSLITSNNPSIDEEVLKSEVEVSGRRLVLETAYNEPTYPCSHIEKYSFLSSVHDSLDIALNLFEISLASDQMAAAVERTTSAAASTSGTGEVSRAATPQTVKQDPGVMMIPILEDLVDLLGVESWNSVFGWLETRNDRFTANLIPSKGKAMPLLRSLNGLLRNVSRTTVPVISNPFPSTSSSSPQSTSQYTDATTALELRARIHIYISQTFRLSDMSGVNLRGEYWVDDGIKGGELGENEEDVDAEGDVNMQTEGEETIKDQENEDQTTQILHSSLWHLQPYFSNPPILSFPLTQPSNPALETLDLQTNETPMEGLKRYVGVVLPVLGEYGRRSGGAGGEDQGRGEEDQEMGFVRSKALLQSQLSSLAFRRRILVQLLFLLQIVRNLDAKDKGKLPKDVQFRPEYTASPEDVRWAIEKIGEVKECLNAEEKGGKEFAAMVTMMMAREAHYATWKHLGCKPFERPPYPESELHLAERNRKAFLAALRPYKYSAGTIGLSRMNQDPLTDVEQLKDFRIPSTLDSLKEEYDKVAMDEGDAKAMGQDDAKRLGPWVEDKASLSWRALRLIINENIDVLNKVPNGDLPTLHEQVAERAATSTGTGIGAVDMRRVGSGDSAGTPEPSALSPKKKVDEGVKDVKMEAREEKAAAGAGTEQQDVVME